ncbi:MFS transporter [Corynebacterium sp. AOP40-9SA-29]|uniref:MFS transporter n=1 Tax=Corynebacterium sp. AOP40-9SA-29 TaxID=3457677 RepID=UPI004034F5D9
MPAALYALALGGFGIGLTEFVIMGLLPEVAADFGVTDTTAGYLISGYALSVAVGGIILTVALRRMERRTALLGLLVLFIVGNMMSALAPTYGLMLAGRIVAALCHGAFFGIGAVVAADLVTPARRAGAISMMFAGLTVANVAGVPLGTFIGQAFGWRATFWAITAVGLVAFAAIAALVPASPAPSAAGAASPASGGGSVREEFAIFRSGQVWLSMAVTVLGYGGMFGAFTYIAFTLTEVSGFSSATVPWLLVLFGVGLFVGNLAGGRAADRNLGATLAVLLGVLTVILVGFALTATSQIATVVALVLMGGVGFATVPGLQMRIMNHASDAPTLASGANIAAFNVGNAVGAWLSGLALFVAASRARGGEFARTPGAAAATDATVPADPAHV